MRWCLCNGHLCGRGITLALFPRERLRGAVAPCQVVQRSRAALRVLFLAPSCLAGTEVSLLPSPLPFPHACFAPCPTRILFSQRVFKQKSIRAGCGRCCLPVAESKVTGPGILCWMQQKPGEHRFCYPRSCARSCTILELVLSLGLWYRKPQPLISLPLNLGCMALSKIRLSSFLPPH